ncbi:hypothetical protein QFC22_006384 [Naganishia vaughanmartiniae]|uniref:Uncharacterized protein n=1 Tax=Naganishia vaughanmartiniae TaxID=1424756 RepID=A0ACC2WL76_9TREE|nr:hypothetical protein QFC22_006384 [Naganishia vaughanmartiniae]
MYLSLLTIFQTLRLVAALPAQQVTPPVCSPATFDSTAKQDTLLVEPKLSAATPQTPLPEGDCCGYIVTDRDNAYFRYRSILDFSSMSSLAEVEAAGWSVSHGWRAGGDSDSDPPQTPMADRKNVQIVKGKGLTLTVPAQANGATFSVAEVVFDAPVFGGIFETNAQITQILGTCVGFFTYHADKKEDKLGWEDEQDIEMLGESLFQAGSGGPGGMMLTNYNPNTGESTTNNKLFPANVDPSTTFHDYTISWFPAGSNSNTPKITVYHFDGKPMAEKPGKSASTHPSRFIINHWTNGPNGWTGGPPNQDAVMTIKSVTMYYDEATLPIDATSTVSKDESCSKEKACRVTMGN